MDRERQLLDAGKLAYEMGAYDLVPLQLRLRLHGSEGGKVAGVAGLAGAGVGVGAGAGVPATVVAAAAGGMKVIREVLRCNPEAYKDGERGGATEDVSGGGEGLWMGGGETLFGTGEVGCVCASFGLGSGLL